MPNYKYSCANKDKQHPTAKKGNVMQCVFNIEAASVFSHSNIVHEHNSIVYGLWIVTLAPWEADWSDFMLRNLPHWSCCLLTCSPLHFIFTYLKPLKTNCLSNMFNPQQ